MSARARRAPLASASPRNSGRVVGRGVLIEQVREQGVQVFTGSAEFSDVLVRDVAFTGYGFGVGVFVSDRGLFTGHRIPADRLSAARRRSAWCPA